MKNKNSIILTIGLGIFAMACNPSTDGKLGMSEDSLAVKDTVYIIQKETYTQVNTVTDENGKTYSSSAPTQGYEGASKKKMNATTKGAIIGAGTGAVTGAIVDKKHRGRGAVVGGLLGAGAGAVTGSVIDKKKGN
ncbi:glycine zipper 2TM domain-containing protein [Lacihabitans sp. LS3-19]|uniref:YMGG-like glycine zipper-containing protein n=1 Tax=Lacihabitans sp. LS3-19 TaxID=2487335 RepID=UPI0020CE3548|nr:YMGG-like glycine zipper-containing protein [Lacihabitans sp. LS3-19]MCP9768927.1 glycine zipper 2TM domain-containing protein [Lacihabitans sp. LS3-19]